MYLKFSKYNIKCMFPKIHSYFVQKKNMNGGNEQIFRVLGKTLSLKMSLKL